MGYTVVALDLDHEALNTLGASTTRQRKGRARERIYPVMADVDRDLPLKTEQLDLALAVHCSIHNNLEAIKTAVRPGGFLIYETFGGQGMNWQDLPKAGQVRTELKREFELLTLQERRVGPEEERSVVVRLFARKRHRPCDGGKGRKPRPHPAGLLR
jgi:SAM-dependent methyltransferase